MAWGSLGKVNNEEIDFDSSYVEAHLNNRGSFTNEGKFLHVYGLDLHKRSAEEMNLVARS